MKLNTPSREELVDLTLGQVKDDYTSCDFVAFKEVILDSLPDHVLWSYLDRRDLEDAAMTGEQP